MFATQMRNFAYLIGDRQTGDCMVVDPAYAAGDLLDTLEADGMHLSGVLVTHHHPDHVGGEMMGFSLQGLAELLDRAQGSRCTSIPMRRFGFPESRESAWGTSPLTRAGTTR